MANGTNYTINLIDPDVVETAAAENQERKGILELLKRIFKEQTGCWLFDYKIES